MMWTQIRWVSAVAAAVMATGIVGGIAVQSAVGGGGGFGSGGFGGGTGGGGGRTAPPMLNGRAAQPAAPAADAGRGEQEETGLVAKFDNGIALNFITMSEGQLASQTAPWWAPDGTPRTPPPLPVFSTRGVGGGGNRARGGIIGGITGVVQLKDGDEMVADFYLNASGARWAHGLGSAPPPSPAQKYITFNFQAYSRPQDDHGTTDIHFSLAAGPWTYFHVRTVGSTVVPDADGVGASTFYPGTGARTLAIDTFDKQVGTVQRRTYVELKEEAAPVAGRVMPTPAAAEGVAGPVKSSATFSGLVEENVAGVWLGARAQTMSADFKGVSLHAGMKSQVETESRMGLDLPMREAVKEQFIVPVQHGEGVKLGVPLAAAITGLDKTYDMTSARVGEMWVDEGRACGVVERVKRLDDKAEVKLGVTLERRDSKWVLVDFNPRTGPGDVEAYLAGFRKSAGKAQPAEGGAALPATEAPAAGK